jgi:hypothetical protein
LSQTLAQKDTAAIGAKIQDNEFFQVFSTQFPKKKKNKTKIS